MAKLAVPKSTQELPKAVIKQMLTLSTSGLGLVAALAWNEVVKEAIGSYVKPLIGESSGLVSLFLYALMVTALAVVVTLQLTKLEQHLEKR